MFEGTSLHGSIANDKYRSLDVVVVCLCSRLFVLGTLIKAIPFADVLCSKGCVLGAPHKGYPFADTMCSYLTPPMLKYILRHFRLFSARETFCFFDL